MGEVQETQLPGVGTRFDYRTSEGDLVAVLHHRSGRRELLLYDRDDPDRCHTLLRLSADDTRTLAELLGASRVVEHLAEMQQQVSGLAIDWLDVAGGSRWEGRTLEDAQVHTRTGVSIVAVLRDEETLPAPGASFRLAAGDRLVAVGRPDGIAQLERELAAPPAGS
jgi:TrkA domain protein